MIKNSISLIFLLLFSTIYSSNRPLFDYWRYKLKMEEQAIIKEFCALRGITIKDFMIPAPAVREDICDNNRQDKYENTLHHNQKSEIKAILHQEGIDISDSKIVQYKKEHDDSRSSNVSVLSCIGCPQIIVSRGFWNRDHRFRSVAIRHEASHIRHEDSTRSCVIKALWNYVAKEQPNKAVQFYSIFHKFKKFCEKRADIEALLASPIEESSIFLKKLSIDSSVEKATFILTRALTCPDVTVQEQKNFADCLEYTKSLNNRTFDKIMHERVENALDAIEMHKDRFVFMEQPIAVTQQGYPCKADYPAALERYQYCSMVLKDIQDLQRFQYTGSWWSKAREIMLGIWLETRTGFNNYAYHN